MCMVKILEWQGFLGGSAGGSGRGENGQNRVTLCCGEMERVVEWVVEWVREWRK